MSGFHRTPRGDLQPVALALRWEGVPAVAVGSTKLTIATLDGQLGSFRFRHTSGLRDGLSLRLCDEARPVRTGPFDGPAFGMFDNKDSITHWSREVLMMGFPSKLDA